MLPHRCRRRGAATFVDQVPVAEIGEHLAAQLWSTGELASMMASAVFSELSPRRCCVPSVNTGAPVRARY